VSGRAAEAHRRAVAAVGGLLAALPPDSGFAEWNAGNALATDGLPVFFHVTDAEEPFNVFCMSDDCSIGSHFGTLHAAEERRQIIWRMVAPDEREGFLIPVVARAANPLVLPDCLDWEFERVCDALLDDGVIDEAEADWLRERWDTAAIFAVLEAKGHDAVLYCNEHEGASRDGSDDNLSLMVWRAEQAKSPWSRRFDRADPRLCSQAAAGAAEERAWAEMGGRIDAHKEAFEALSAPRP